MHIRIGFFSKELPSNACNGVSVQVHRLANALCRRGHTVVCHSFSPKPESALYEHRHFDTSARNRVIRKFVPALHFRRARAEDFDCIHFHGDDFLCTGTSRRFRTFYGSALDEARHARSISRVLYQGFFYLMEWVSLLKKGTAIGISRATTRCLPLIDHIIPCGVPLDSYSPAGLKTPHPRILFIGDLDSRKRGRLLVKTFGRIVRAHYPSAELAIVGPQHVSGDGIVYLGQISEGKLIEEYRKAWIYCMISSYEGFGVPALEAMACGTALVAARNAGTEEFVVHTHNGMLCSPHTLGDALLQTLGSAETRSNLIAHGLRTVKQFDIDRCAREYEALYCASVNHIQ